MPPSEVQEVQDKDPYLVPNRTDKIILFSIIGLCTAMLVSLTELIHNPGDVLNWIYLSAELAGVYGVIYFNP